MFFEKNIGNDDRILRLVLAALFAVLGWFYNPWFYVLTGVLGITALFGFCGIYKMFSVDTLDKADILFKHH